ncbi:phosphotransferase family protein [Mycolicibacterium pallens]|uniref:Ecdysteroid 22-kinase family protein n=1 Tax=Mycolicibacterium pallens TaxID=370524 RepID=A0ABX8VKB1_9MYCO|nr:phosphotransferase [Mycolicibacterium pallens]APE18299.1 aminoglycoside phosphotransferase [Mycobacterium sp. WY10]QYL16220.1 ecdysteroid 22-kinase family protein [Mycolicibacterium pallens]
MSAATAIPRYPSDVTGTWLAGVLSAAGAPVEVESVEVTPVGTGQTGATFRVAATYAGNPDNLPASFILKLPAGDDAVRDRVTLGYRSECAFYQSVADLVTIPIPQCYHVEIADEGASYALLLADQAPAVQGDQIAGCDLPEARLAVRALAGLHGPTWCDERWQTFPGLAMSVVGEDAIRGLGDISKMAAGITIEKLGTRLGAEDAETLVAAMDLVTPWLLNAPPRFALLHGDYRLDNLLFDGERVSVVDWQTLGVGLAGRDLAYFTGTSLEPALRAEAEKDLVAEYHRALLDTGVNDYDDAACWYDYVLGMVQVPLISALGCAFAVETERGDDMMAAMLRRGCAAIRDLGTLELITS